MERAVKDGLQLRRSHRSGRVEIAQLMGELVPNIPTWGAYMVSSGTEAVVSAIRLPGEPPDGLRSSSLRGCHARQ